MTSTGQLGFQLSLKAEVAREADANTARVAISPDFSATTLWLLPWDCAQGEEDFYLAFPPQLGVLTRWLRPSKKGKSHCC